MNYARFNGGPLDGQVHETPEEIWPLPVELTLALLSPTTTFGVGRYVRTNQSELTTKQADHPNVGRGADYAWQERDIVVAEIAANEPWNEATGEGVDMSHGRKPAPADWDPRTDYPERFTEGRPI